MHADTQFLDLCVLGELWTSSRFRSQIRLAIVACVSFMARLVFYLRVILELPYPVDMLLRLRVALARSLLHHGDVSVI